MPGSPRPLEGVGVVPVVTGPSDVIQGRVFNNVDDFTGKGREQRVEKLKIDPKLLLD